MQKCETHNYVLGFCTKCLWPVRNGEDIERARDAVLMVDELRDTQGLSEADAIKRVHKMIADPITIAGKAGKDGLADP
jgi:hypothetical protein